VRGAAPVPDADLARQREVVAAFLAAARAGDFEALVEVLDPEAVFRIDAGGAGPRALEPVSGAAAVAKTVLARGARFAPHARPALVNGAAGLIVGSEEAPYAVIGFTVVGGRIAALDLILDRAKLRRA
jgi:RNA polymerase sigma-70 factor (ECF subfamily)